MTPIRALVAITEIGGLNSHNQRDRQREVDNSFRFQKSPQKVNLFKR